MGIAFGLGDSTQVPIALSSAEAEYYSMSEGAAKAIGLKAMLEELGVFVEEPLRLFTDSSAARAFAARRGVGRMRHVEVRHLWLQAMVQQKTIVIEKIAGPTNPADLLTKYMPEQAIRQHLSRLGLCFVASGMLECRR